MPVMSSHPSCSFSLQTLASTLGLVTTGFTVEAGPAQAWLAEFAFDLVGAVYVGAVYVGAVNVGAVIRGFTVEDMRPAPLRLVLLSSPLIL